MERTIGEYRSTLLRLAPLVNTGLSFTPRIGDPRLRRLHWASCTLAKRCTSDCVDAELSWRGRLPARVQCNDDSAIGELAGVRGSTSILSVSSRRVPVLAASRMLRNLRSQPGMEREKSSCEGTEVTSTFPVLCRIGRGPPTCFTHTWWYAFSNPHLGHRSRRCRIRRPSTACSDVSVTTLQ